MLQVDGAGGTTLIVPPVAVVGIATPAASADAGLPTASAAVVAAIPGRTVTVAVATTPLEIMVAFTPNKMQSTHPALFAHVSVLPAAVAAAPATKVTELTEDIGYVSRHCMPAGNAPPVGVAVRSTFTTPPGCVVADPSESVSCCAFTVRVLAAITRPLTNNPRNACPKVLVVLSMATLSAPTYRQMSWGDRLVLSTRAQYSSYCSRHKGNRSDLTDRPNSEAC